MIQIKNLRAGYDGKEILNIPSLTFNDGEITAVVGLNGSGKSTLLKSILGMNRYAGDLLVDGKNLLSSGHKTRAKTLAYLPQVHLSASLDVYTLVCHGRFPYLGFSKVLGQKDRDFVEKALRLTDMWEKREKNLAEISGGERQRAYLAMVIAQDTRMILLDEPTTYMDIKHQVEILRVLRSLADQGRGIVLTSHDLPQSFSLCDRVCLMQNGSIVAQGRSEELLADSSVVRSVMGVSLREVQGDVFLYRYGIIQ